MIPRKDVVDVLRAVKAARTCEVKVRTANRIVVVRVTKIVFREAWNADRSGWQVVHYAADKGVCLAPLPDDDPRHLIIL